jgi:glycerol-3-phosphate acyltransferase PlsX
MRVALDAMGGDNAPEVVVKGACQAVEKHPDLEITLIGPRDVVTPLVEAEGSFGDRISVHHASQILKMDEHPVEGIRRKRDASIFRAVELVASGEAAAAVSAGNTGGAVAAGTLYLRPLEGVHRPGIAINFPTEGGALTTIIDVGANIQCRPIHLFQYGIMAVAYRQLIDGLKSPRVALLNVGTEDAKGTSLVQEAHALFKKSSLNFVGNVEGRDLFAGVADVVVCDGFVGNVVLKVAEGMAQHLLKTFKGILDDLEIARNDGVRRKLDAIDQANDYATVGGAPLLGVSGVVIVCHGRSNDRAIANAVGVARRLAECRLNEETERMIELHTAQTAERRA